MDMDVRTVSQSVEQFFAGKAPEDLLLLYFSGHGLRSPRDGRLHLAVKDTRRNLLMSTSLPAPFVTELLDDSACTRQLLILDCCYSGAFAAGVKDEEVIGSSVGTKTLFEGNGRGRVVLTASDETQYAWQGDTLLGGTLHSVFTHFLVEGLRTGDADLNNDGFVSVDELYTYTRKQVAAQRPNQHPKMWAYNMEAVIELAMVPPNAVKLSPLPEGISEALENPLARIRLEAVNTVRQFLDGENRGLILAANKVLQRALEDDSISVRRAAEEALNEYESRRLSGKSAPRNRVVEKPTSATPSNAVRSATELHGMPKLISQARRINAVDGLSYVWIPPGEFMMGCVPEDVVRVSEEFPLHAVRLTKGFWISETCIPMAAFYKFATSTTSPKDSNASATPELVKQLYPVVNVTWHEARNYCHWAGGRLPTESEWEYCARAAEPKRIYAWPSRYKVTIQHNELHLKYNIVGDIYLPYHNVVVDSSAKVKGNLTASRITVYGSIEGNVGVGDAIFLRKGSSVVGDIRTVHIVIEDGAYFKGSTDIIRSNPSPVSAPSERRVEPIPGLLRVKRIGPNNFGVFDLPAFWSEWCADWFDGLYYRVSPVLDPQGPKSGVSRVLRGSSFADYPFYFRLSARQSMRPQSRSKNVGFRCVLDE